MTSTADDEHTAGSRMRPFHSRKLTFALAIGFCSVAASFVQGQDALRNAVREDAAYQGRQIAARAEPTGWKAGPVYFTPSVSFSAEYNDNVRNTEQKESDVVLTPGAHVTGLWLATDRSRLSFGVGFGYTKYLEHSDLTRGYVSPDSEIAYDFSVKDVVISVYDKFSYSQETFSEPSLSGIANLPRIENTIGTRITWNPNKALYSVGYAHENFRTVEGTNAQLDHVGEHLTMRAGYRFHAETTAGLEGTAAWTDYLGEAQRDNLNLTIGPFLEWQARPWLGIKIHASYIHYEFTPTNSFDHPDPLDSYYASVEINHHLTDHITHNVTASHDFQPSFYEGGGYTETSAVRYSINYAFHQNTSLEMHFVYEVGKEPGGVILRGNEEFDRLGIGLALRYSLTEKLSAGVGYDYLNRTSNLPERTYDQNRVFLNLTYTF